MAFVRDRGRLTDVDTDGVADGDREVETDGDWLGDGRLAETERTEAVMSFDGERLTVIEIEPVGLGVTEKGAVGVGSMDTLVVREAERSFDNNDMVAMVNVGGGVSDSGRVSVADEESVSLPDLYVAVPSLENVVVTAAERERGACTEEDTVGDNDFVWCLGGLLVAVHSLDMPDFDAVIELLFVGTGSTVWEKFVGVTAALTVGEMEEEGDAVPPDLLWVASFDFECVSVGENVGVGLMVF